VRHAQCRCTPVGPEVHVAELCRRWVG
jgi:hypothetical protein